MYINQFRPADPEQMALTAVQTALESSRSGNFCVSATLILDLFPELRSKPLEAETVLDLAWDLEDELRFRRSSWNNRQLANRKE